MVETILEDKKLRGFAIAGAFTGHVVSDPGLVLVSLLRHRR